jgi:pimeloyl-ACP methyl ester carboxylesterase
MISTLKRSLTPKRVVKVSSFLSCAAFLLMSAPAAMAQQASTGAVESRYATVDGARIHYRDYGKGREALVLIHGWTCNLDHWRDQIPDFAKRTRVIALDLPGHGQSDKPEIKYNIELFAKAVDAVMRDAKVDRGVIVGHSMGTPIARQFYRKYPEKSLAIVIVDGGLRLFGNKEARDGFIAAFRSPDYKETATKMFAGMAGPYLSTELRERVRSSFLNTPQYVLVSAMESMNEESLYGPDKMNVPVLAILAKSPFWQPDTEQFLRSIAPDLEYHMWEGVGHFLMMEKPKQFNEAVIAFLNKKALLK